MNDRRSKTKGTAESNQGAASSVGVERRKILVGMGGLAASVSIAPFVGTAAGAEEQTEQGAITLKTQGSFAVGGTVVTAPGTFDPFAGLISPPAGQTLHGDHAYVQYQIPPDARELPLVMWHGGGQFSKTWESTPDGRDGYQNIFVRRGFSTYIIDQPARGRAGKRTVGGTITAAAIEQSLFIIFRLGIWPNFFPSVQFSRDPAALDQYWRQVTPDTAPTGSDVTVAAVVALFNKIGSGILLTHSASGGPGWLTAMASDDVKAVISYEPVQFYFPEGEVPAPIVSPRGTNAGVPVPLATFMELTKKPIQIVYGDNIPRTAPSPYPGLDLWYGATNMANNFVEAINRHGGDAQVLHLPDVGIRGNTHFPFSDLNNVAVADELSKFLSAKQLDRR